MDDNRSPGGGVWACGAGNPLAREPGRASGRAAARAARPAGALASETAALGEALAGIRERVSRIAEHLIGGDPSAGKAAPAVDETCGGLLGGLLGQAQEQHRTARAVCASLDALEVALGIERETGDGGLLTREEWIAKNQP